jgi:hypothetical protein
MTNPLIAKWEELNNPKKEEPKPNNFISATNASVSFIPKPYTRHDSTIATLEALLEDLKSGRAIMTDLKTQPNCNSLATITNPTLIDRGDKITLEIFRQYD